MAKALFIVIMIFNSGVLAGKVHNPFGVPFSSEIFSVFLIAFTAFYFYYHLLMGKKVLIEDISIVVITVSAWLLSAIFATLHFGQPLVFGLIEERRVFEILIYFPLVFFLSREVVSFEFIIKTIFWLGLILASTLCIIYIQTHGVSGGEAGREDRMSLGTSYVLLSLIALLSVFISRSNINSIYGLNKVTLILAGIFFLGVLVFIVQNRQILLSFGLVSLLTMTWRNKKLLISCFVLAVILLNVVDLSNFYNMVIELGSDDYLTKSARSKTLAIIYSELTENNFIGMGALSNLWNGGFSKVYYDYFFLSDVGVSGTLYRYGILAPFFVLPIIFLLNKNISKLADITPQVFLRMLFWYMLILLPLGSLVENRGSLTGLVLGMAVGIRSRKYCTGDKLKVNDYRRPLQAE